MSVAEVVKGVVMILLTAVVLACLAVACSALLRRTQAATVVAYGLTAALTIGTFIVYGGQRAMDGPVNKASPAILALNPFVATADVVQGRNDELTSFDSPFTALVDLVRPDTSGSRPGVGRRVRRGRRQRRRIARRWRVPVPMPMPRPMPPALIRRWPRRRPRHDARPAPAAGARIGARRAAGRSPASAVAVGDDPVILGAGRAPAGSSTAAVSGPVPAVHRGGLRRPRAEVAGLRMWVAWLVGSAVARRPGPVRWPCAG